MVFLCLPACPRRYQRRTAELMQAMLRTEAELMWFGGIGTYIKASSEAHIEVSDPANDKLRVNGRDVRAALGGTAVGTGANTPKNYRKNSV